MIKLSALRKPSVKQLQSVYKHAWWTKARKDADVAKMLRHPQVLMTAWDGKTLVGFARVLTDFTYRAIIADVMVLPAYEGKGIGSDLVQKAMHDKRLKTVTGFWLYTTDKQAFYKKLGFEFSPKHLMIHRKGC
jgi:N-acetylglutamate synthase-like GNAT family acetyltransferase